MQSAQRDRAAAAKIKAILNAGRKKSVHVSLFTSTLTGFRKILLERQLSVQEVFEHFASLVKDEHPSLMKLLEEYSESKKEKLITQLEEKYTENLYKLISEENFEDGSENAT